MYSSKWKMREQGVSEFISGMEAAMDQAVQEQSSAAQNEPLTPEQRCNQALIVNMNEVLTDKVQQIVKKTVAMIETYQGILDKHKQINPKWDSSNFEKLLVNFLDKLADAKSAVSVQKAYGGFFSTTQLECVYLINFLFRP